MELLAFATSTLELERSTKKQIRPESVILHHLARPSQSQVQ